MIAAGGGKSVPIVRRWIDTFNRRDAHGFGGTLSDDIDFKPLRLEGLGGRYQGRPAVERWFAQVQLLPAEYLISVDEIEELTGDSVAVSGSMTLPNGRAVAPFWGLYRVRSEVVAAVRQYLTDPALASYLGLTR